MARWLGVWEGLGWNRGGEGRVWRRGGKEEGREGRREGYGDMGEGKVWRRKVYCVSLIFLGEGV